MPNVTTFLGKPVEYWLELQERADELDVTHLITDLANLHAKVSFYESKLAEIDMFRQVVMGNKV